MSEKKRLVSITKLILLVFIFVVPIIGAKYFYSNADKFHFSTTNHGYLLTPAVNINALLSEKQQSNKWQLIYYPRSCADAEWKRTNFTLNQIKIALGEKGQRLKLSLIDMNGCDAKSYPQISDLNLSDQQTQQLKQYLLKNKVPPEYLALGHIYFIDPLGNLFMVYGLNVRPQDLVTDIKRVLEVSQIG